MNVSSALSQLKDPWDQRLVALEDDAKAIESSMHVAQAIVRQYAARLNALNRIVSLPVEILEHIFLALQRVESTSTGPVHHEWSVESEWVLVTHVCHRWRQVAISYRRLWTDVDVDVYGITLCKEMLSRLGSHPFALSATVKAHEDFLFATELRKRIPAQLSRSSLNFDDTVTLPGAFLDTLLSHTGSQAGLALKELSMSCRNPQHMIWATLERILSSLTSLSLTHLNPYGAMPSSLPMLADLTFNSVNLAFGNQETPGILELISAMPVLETAKFISCSFPPVDVTKVALPSSMKLLQFEAYSEWPLQQCRALSRLLTQTTGDRVFMIGFANVNMEEIFSEVKDADELGLKVDMMLVEVTGWGTLDATIEFERTASERTRPYRIMFRHITPSSWPTFCSTIKDIGMQNAGLRLVCDRATPFVFTQDIDMLQELRQLTMSTIYLTGRMSAFSAINLFNMMRQPLNEAGHPLPFPNLRDVYIEHPPSAATVEIPSLVLPTVEWLSIQLDEAALYLPWYARARREHDLEPLRTVALPADLLQKHWAVELNDLVENKVLSYDQAIEADDGNESTDCRAVVLYRLVLRALRFWETWILPFAPVISTLGTLWTISRHR